MTLLCRRRRPATAGAVRWLLVAFACVGCSTTPTRPRTALEARAYQAFDACWTAGGAGSPGFSATQEGGKLYALMDSGSFGSAMSSGQFEAISACMANKGVTPIWGFPPSMMGGRRP